MAAGVVIPVAGPYVGLWATKALGVMNDDGFELSATAQGQEVNETDAYGMTLVEAVYRGVNWRCRFRGLEWNKEGLLNALQMFGRQGASGNFQPILAGPATTTYIGTRWTSVANVLLLTAIMAVYPPSTPAVITATSAALAPNQQTSFNLTSKVREMPLEFVLYPYSAVIGADTYILPFVVT